MRIDAILKPNSYHVIKGDIYYCLPKHLGDIKQTEVKTYSHRAEEFDAKKALHMDRPLFTTPMREYGKEDTMFLEIAGGMGQHGLNMMKDGYKVIASDIAVGATKRSKKIAQTLGIDETGAWAVIDAENLPFQDDTLDGVWMIASLHHLPHPKKALSEIFRILKPGGCILIGYEPAKWQYILLFPFMWIIRKILRAMNPRRPVSKADDVTFGFSKRHLTKMLNKAGFSNIRIAPIHYLYKTYKNYRILVSKFLGHTYKESKTVRETLIKIDVEIAKIPALRNTTWDWDCLAYKQAT